jgi:hypothetical protein
MPQDVGYGPEQTQNMVFAQRTDAGAVVYLPYDGRNSQDQAGDPVYLETGDGQVQLVVPIKMNKKQLSNVPQRGQQIVDLNQAAQQGLVKVHPYNEQTRAALQGMQQGATMGKTTRVANERFTGAIANAGIPGVSGALKLAGH